MSILESLAVPVTKTTPDVWISRVLIFGKPTEPPIREVPLKPGLNIVWAEEPDDEDDKRDVAGHSAGKTTFCRLLRYVLGEKTFGNKSNTALIRRAFPNGYVAAELFVKGVKWAVRRPLGENRSSYVLKDATIEELIEARGEPAFQDTYPAKIGLEALLDPLASATVVRTNETIKWGHLLAWCARDQEARFQNIHDWRSPRSESDWPAFRFPKSDPLFVMRIVLGLFLPNELRGEEELATLQHTLDDAETALEVARKEPAYWNTHYDEKVRKRLQEILPGDAGEIRGAPISTDEILPDLKRYTAKAKYLVGEQIQKAEGDELAVRNAIDTLNEAIAADRKESDYFAALFQVRATGESEATAGLKLDEQTKRRAAEDSDKMCPYGDVLIGECSYVLARQKRVELTAIKDAHTLEQMEAEAAAERTKIVGQQEGLRHRIRDDEAKRRKLTQRQSELLLEITQKQAVQKDLDADLENLLSWKGRQESPEIYAKLQAQVGAIQELRQQVEAKKGELTKMLADHETNRDLLNSIFSTAAKRVLPSANYDGKVQLQDRELHFQITHGEAMTGEAMETLAVLLADISCLVYNSLSSQSSLPGFLLHDSPREADLGLRLYRGFFRFAALLAAEFEDRGGVPFQYVITTTTAPPKALINDKFVALQLDASQEAELLFRRDLSKPPAQDQLELP
jgi:hypothetical protein